MSHNEHRDIDPSEVEMWSDPLSIWSLLTSRRELHQQAQLLLNLVEAQRHTILRQRLEIDIMDGRLERHAKRNAETD